MSGTRKRTTKEATKAKDLPKQQENTTASQKQKQKENNNNKEEEEDEDDEEENSEVSENPEEAQDTDHSNGNGDKEKKQADSQPPGSQQAVDDQPPGSQQAVDDQPPGSQQAVDDQPPVPKQQKKQRKNTPAIPLNNIVTYRNKKTNEIFTFTIKQDMERLGCKTLQQYLKKTNIDVKAIKMAAKSFAKMGNIITWTNLTVLNGVREDNPRGNMDKMRFDDAAILFADKKKWINAVIRLLIELAIKTGKMLHKSSKEDKQASVNAQQQQRINEAAEIIPDVAKFDPTTGRYIINKEDHKSTLKFNQALLQIHKLTPKDVWTDATKKNKWKAAFKKAAKQIWDKMCPAPPKPAKPKGQGNVAKPTSDADLVLIGFMVKITPTLWASMYRLREKLLTLKNCANYFNTNPYIVNGNFDQGKANSCFSRLKGDTGDGEEGEQ